MLASVKGSGHLADEKDGERAVALQRRVTRAMRSPPSRSTRRRPSQRPIAKPTDPLARHPAIA